MSLLLVCIFDSAPGTVSWDENGKPITSGDSFIIDSTFDDLASVYIMKLIVDAANTSELKGVVSCHAQSTQRVQTNGGVKLVNAKGKCS